MFNEDSENKFAALLGQVEPADRAAMTARMRAASAHFDAVRLGVLLLVAGRNATLVMESWDVAQRAI